MLSRIHNTRKAREKATRSREILHCCGGGHVDQQVPALCSGFGGKSDDVEVNGVRITRHEFLHHFHGVLEAQKRNGINNRIYIYVVQLLLVYELGQREIIVPVH